MLGGVPVNSACTEGNRRLPRSPRGCATACRLVQNERVYVQFASALAQPPPADVGRARVARCGHRAHLVKRARSHFTRLQQGDVLLATTLLGHEPAIEIIRRGGIFRPRREHRSSRTPDRSKKNKNPRTQAYPGHRASVRRRFPPVKPQLDLTRGHCAETRRPNLRASLIETL